jgi:hypothetical protein
VIPLKWAMLVVAEWNIVKRPEKMSAAVTPKHGRV